MNNPNTEKTRINTILKNSFLTPENLKHKTLKSTHIGLSFKQ